MSDELRRKADEAVKEAAGALGETLSGGMDSVRGLWDSLDDDTRTTAVNALIGSLVGGGLGGVSGAYGADEEAGESALYGGLGKGAIGALLGALVGGGGTAAYKLMNSGPVLPGERGTKDQNWIDKSVDRVAGTVGGNLGATGGLALGSILGSRPSWSTGYHKNIQDYIKGKVDMADLAGFMDPSDLKRESSYIKSMLKNTTADKAVGQQLDDIVRSATGQVDDTLVEKLKGLSKSVSGHVGDSKQVTALRNQFRRGRLAEKISRRLGRRAKLLGLALPALGLGTGMLADRYLQGDY